MTREEIRARIADLSEESYAKFTAKLVPNAANISGVRLPVLRNLAKEIATENYRTILQPLEDDLYEEIMLRGIVIGLVKCNFEAKMSLVEDFVPQIKNWAICDSFCMPLKASNQNKRAYREFIDKYIDSTEEYEQRSLLFH